MQSEIFDAALPNVINWHVTEACNFRCQYCYAKWQQPNQKELIRDPALTKDLLLAIFKNFGHQKPGSKPRLNFAGGEPLLYGSRVISAMEMARSIGFEVSLISNGSKLTEPMIRDLAPILTMLGLSVDSSSEAVNRVIGRHDSRGAQVNLDELAQQITLAKRLNRSLKLKMNTVVNAANWQENMNALVQSFSPDRWKVLRMLPVTTQNLEVTDAQFQAFVNRHAGLGAIMCTEDNSDMVESYVMLDPHGRFFQNTSNGKGYGYSQPILQVGAKHAFEQVRWSAGKFASRYVAMPIAETA